MSTAPPPKPLADRNYYGYLTPIRSRVARERSQWTATSWLSGQKKSQAPPKGKQKDA
jgi:hypothetical protein